MHQGSCHCGAVRVTLPATPVVATRCNCSLCRRIGGPWVYFEFGTVKIDGHPESTPRRPCASRRVWPRQTVRRLRPRSRRRFNTARPPRVLMRSRKPWTFFLRRLCGWNVRFTVGMPLFEWVILRSTRVGESTGRAATGQGEAVAKNFVAPLSART